MLEARGLTRRAPLPRALYIHEVSDTVASLQREEPRALLQGQQSRVAAGWASPRTGPGLGRGLAPLLTRVLAEGPLGLGRGSQAPLDRRQAAARSFGAPSLSPPPPAAALVSAAGAPFHARPSFSFSENWKLKLPKT